MPSVFRCPNCGATLEVVAGRTDVKCAQCGTVTNLSDLLARMEPANLPPTPPDRPGPLAWLLIGNRLGCCGCLAAVITLLLFAAIALFIANVSTPGGIIQALTQAAH